MTKQDRPPRRGRYIVECPACEGTGREARPGSTVLHGCRLCWERGVVARIVAERWIDRTRPDGAAAH
jgi:hypothetical protein